MAKVRMFSMAFLPLVIMDSFAFAQKKKPSVVSPPPIVQTFSSVPEKYGDWSLTSSGDGWYITSTVNEAGSAFGAICNPKGCFSFINPQISCEENATYPALINAPSAGYTAKLTCAHYDKGKSSILLFDNDQAVIDAMSVGGNLGVAMPMQSGEFKVSRFSLTGAMRAYARAAQLAGVAARRPGQGSGVTDSRL